MRKSTQILTPVTYIGIDYHKKFIVVTLGDQQGNVVGMEKVVNDRELIVRFFAPYVGVTCAVESCRGYEWFVDLLKELGLTVHLANPYQMKLIANSRRKTDKVDSKAIMELLAKGYLPTCYQPTPEERRLREQLRWRAHLVRYAVRIRVRIHSLLDKENVTLPVSDIFSQAGHQLLCQVQLKPGRQELLEQHLEILSYFDRLVAREDALVKRMAKSSPDAQLLMTVPGIGHLSALIIISELGNVTRFGSSRQVSAYAGLVPSIYASASTRRLGSLTKQGSRILRWILIQCAWQSIRKSNALRQHFSAVSRRCGKNAAVCSVARKLLQIAWRVLKDKQPFIPELVGQQRAN